MVTEFATVAEAVRKLPSPFKKEDVIRAIRTVNPTASRATVYRLRGRLEREGCLKKIGLSDRRRLHVHGHEEVAFIAECTDCGLIRCVTSQESGVPARLLPQAAGFQLSRVYVRSVCAGCSPEENARA